MCVHDSVAVGDAMVSFGLEAKHQKEEKKARILGFRSTFITPGEQNYSVIPTLRRATLHDHIVIFAHGSIVGARSYEYWRSRGEEARGGVKTRPSPRFFFPSLPRRAHIKRHTHELHGGGMTMIGDDIVSF